jgi:hypothetical protein
MHLDALPSRRTEKRRAYGTVTAKALAVPEALLWVFHNRHSGLCFPSYERIAEGAGCARSTVAEALKTLEEAGILSWVQRIKRVRAMPRSAGRQRLALADPEDIKRLQSPRPRLYGFF